NDKETLKLAHQGMKDNGGTSFSAAINASIAQIDSAEKISNGANKNRIILLSDGDDGDSASKRNVAVQKCKDKFIEVYPVGFGSANDAILRKIAEETGGEYYR
ncbi:VWA domain-containing protein, partial [[Eubacterium] siraeum]|nr:VWA domain-containing protein [[Eubacterium] siraeum]